MNKRYVLILASLNPDNTDLSATSYPEAGYVECKHYRPDENIMFGLYGTLWGDYKSDRWLNKDLKAQWKVVRADNDNNIVHLDKINGFVKYRSGIVILSGSKEDCLKHISENSGLRQIETSPKLMEKWP